MEAYSSAEMAAATAVPISTLDYWERVGLLAPSLVGDCYTAREVALGIVLAELSRLGCATPALAAVAGRLEGDPVDWPESLWVTARGEVAEQDSEAAAVVVHTRQVLSGAGPQLFLALAS